MKKYKGAALIYVVIISVIVMSFLVLTTSLMITNTQRILRQQKRVEAFYASTAGIELGTAAVLKQRVVNSTQTSFLEEFQSNPFKEELIQEDILVGAIEDGRKVSIYIHAVDVKGNRWTASSSGEVWVEIVSKGWSPNGNGFVEYVGNIRILTTNPAVVVRNMIFAY